MDKKDFSPYNPNNPINNIKENIYHANKFDNKIDGIEKSLGFKIDILSTKIGWFFMLTILTIISGFILLAFNH